MEKKEIQTSDILKPGDLIQIEFKLAGPNVMKYAVLSGLEAKYKQKHPDYEFVRADYSAIDSGFVYYTFKVLPEAIKDPSENVQKAGVSAGAVITMITIVGGAFLLYLTVSKVYQLTDNPAGEIAVGGFGFLAVAAGIYVLWQMKKKN